MKLIISILAILLSLSAVGQRKKFPQDEILKACFKEVKTAKEQSNCYIVGYTSWRNSLATILNERDSPESRKSQAAWNSFIESHAKFNESLMKHLNTSFSKTPGLVYNESKYLYMRGRVLFLNGELHQADKITYDENEAFKKETHKYYNQIFAKLPFNLKAQFKATQTNWAIYLKAEENDMLSNDEGGSLIANVVFANEKELIKLRHDMLKSIYMDLTSPLKI